MQNRKLKTAPIKIKPKLDIIKFTPRCVVKVGAHITAKVESTQIDFFVTNTNTKYNLTEKFPIYCNVISNNYWVEVECHENVSLIMQV